MATSWTSPPLQIGAHEWRILFTAPGRFGQPWTNAYEWRRRGELDWNPATSWPTYNRNDGTFAGLPRTVRVLWETHEAAGVAAVTGQAPPQADLFA